MEMLKIDDMALNLSQFSNLRVIDFMFDDEVGGFASNQITQYFAGWLMMTDLPPNLHTFSFKCLTRQGSIGFLKEISQFLVLLEMNKTVKKLCIDINFENSNEKFTTHYLESIQNLLDSNRSLKDVRVSTLKNSKV